MNPLSVSATRPIVALVGRTNVGKSTLFNRLSRKTLAIVHNAPGVTRDVRVEPIEFYGMDLILMDTPGLLDSKTKPELCVVMEAHTLQNLLNATLILFIIDARSGLMPLDHDLAAQLRLLNKPIIVLVNKAENPKSDVVVGEAYGLGFSPVLPISAEHGDGLVDLAHVLLKIIHPSGSPYEAQMGVEDDPIPLPDRTKRPLPIAIIGRPNVGKSTLFNTLIGENRQLVHDEPGVTRDAITVPFTYQGRSLELVDTAGMRQKSKIIHAVERRSVQETIRAIRMSQVIIFMIDITETPDHLDKQDLLIASHIAESGKPFVLVLSKSDKLNNPKDAAETIRTLFSAHFMQVKTPSIVLISAKNNTGIPAMMVAAFDLHEKWSRRFSTSHLNKWFESAVSSHPHPSIAGRAVRLKYLSQVRSAPPTFMIQGNRTSEVNEHYTRYLLNSFRDHFDMDGVPIRILYNSSDNPYQGRTKKR